MSGTQLEQLTVAERMLAEVATVEEAVHLVDFASAARDLAKRAKLGASAVNHATVIRVRAERRMAVLVDEGQKAGVIATRETAGRSGGRPSSTENHARDAGVVFPATLSDLGHVLFIEQKSAGKHLLAAQHYAFLTLASLPRTVVLVVRPVESDEDALEYLLYQDAGAGGWTRPTCPSQCEGCHPGHPEWILSTKVRAAEWIRRWARAAYSPVPAQVGRRADGPRPATRS